MEILPAYLQKRALMGPLIEMAPEVSTELMVVIPSFKEPNLKDTLQSLLANQGDYPSTEIIIVLNYPAKVAASVRAEHQHQCQEIRNWTDQFQHSKIRIHCPDPLEMNSRHAGVGLARKIGMDEAVRRFMLLQKPKGVILNLDADCLCSKDYLETVFHYFQSDKAAPCVSIGFEHRITSEDYLNCKAIQDYELHLRYYIEAQRYISYPFAFQTLGSCFAVRADAYAAQGGMNQRQAGEDFYFLHKYSAIHQLGEIKKALVFPSSRLSDRVPFGTGKAISDYTKSGIQKTYALESILLFGELLNRIEDWYTLNAEGIQDALKNLHPKVGAFFIAEGMPEEIENCHKHSASLLSFKNRILRWLSPFMLMKFLHFLREHGFPDQPVGLESIKLLNRLHYVIKPNINSSELLEIFRERSRI